MQYETVIGLEVHVELNTKSKIFCGCSTQFGAPPNQNTCPVCLGHPGVLPVLNQQAVEFAMKAALALNCEIAEYTKFDRKNYFYPDLPKAYQISQYDQPIGKNGWLEIVVNGEVRRIGITRLHLEEDAGKLIHLEGEDASLVDFNRVGVPLIEIVSEPDLRSPEEARAYLEKLRAIMLYTEVSDVRMEEGSLRCDANISLRPVGDKELGTKVELKNLNSFSALERALAYEVQRQTDLLDEGGKIEQETRRWIEDRKETVPMRTKEEAHDYRYFPDPDLVGLHISREWVDRIRRSIPELPDQRRRRYVEEWAIPEYDAGVLTATKKSADFFEAAVATGADAKMISNWMMGELFGYLNKNNLEIDEIPMKPEHLARMVRMIGDGTISGKIAKTVFAEMLVSGKDPESIVKEKGLIQISDEGAIRPLIEKVISLNPQSVADYKAGKERAIGFLVGQVMKETKGKANPQLVNQLLVEMMNKL